MVTVRFPLGIEDVVVSLEQMHSNRHNLSLVFGAEQMTTI
jgi:hypothetical protein